jgi:peptidoglycan/xylan/chitin deacetylase (PgdA/CDA1 family)
MDPRRARRKTARRRRHRQTLTLLLVLVAVAGLIAWGAVMLTGGGSSPSAATPPGATTRAAGAEGGGPGGAGPAAERQPFARLAFPPAPARQSIEAPVLMFHRVASPATATNAVSRDLTVAPATFAAELAWLHAHGYHPIDQAQLFQALELGTPVPPRPIVLTFDDGYVDATTTIAPLLRRYGWPATFFVITGRAGARAFLTWDQIVALDRAGMDVASHTVDHVELPALSAAARWDEITRSKRALERHLGHPEYWFAYPAGAFDGASQADLRRAGYLLSYTTQYGASISSTSPEAEPRVRVHGQGTVAEFAAAVSAASGHP